MADILQDLPVAVSASVLYKLVAYPAGLDRWWTLRCSGDPTVGAVYRLDFGPDYQWSAVCVAAEPPSRFGLRITDAFPDWVGTEVWFDLTPMGTGTRLRFAHVGWGDVGDHYRVSNHCWALYLRLLRRYAERGEEVPYARRLDA